MSRIMILIQANLLQVYLQKFTGWQNQKKIVSFRIAFLSLNFCLNTTKIINGSRIFERNRIFSSFIQLMKNYQFKYPSNSLRHKKFQIIFVIFPLREADEHFQVSWLYFHLSRIFKKFNRRQLRVVQLSYSDFLNNIKMTNFEWTTIEAASGAPRPGPRWGHSCCVVNENLYLFGGFAHSNYMNDLWVYNLKSLAWKEIIAQGDKPQPRSNATLNYDATNNQLLLFGGGGPNKQRFNSISILDLNLLQWVEFPPFENEPSPWERTYHTAEFKFPYLVVFGGEGIDDLGDLWLYNMETLSWKEVKFVNNATQPKGRRFHSSCIIENSIYIFGGCEGKYNCLHDLFQLDLSSFFEAENFNELKWQQIQLHGDQVAARWGHTSYFYNGQIYVFGGRGAEDLQDMFSINPKTGKIKQISTVSSPQARRRHAGGFIGSCMVLFGGFDGNYFNDLLYINFYRNKYQKKQETQLTKTLLYHDYDIYAFNNLKLSINTALIGNYFYSNEDMNQFLNSINNFYLIEELQTAFQTLYNGYGKFPIQKVHKSMMKSFPPQAYPTKIEIMEAIELQSHRTSQKMIENQGKAIELESYQLASYARSIQQHWQNNHFIKLNQNQVIKVNKELLSQSSSFFNILMSKSFRNDKQVSFINMKNCSGMHLTLIYAFLHSKFLIIPKFSSYQFLVEMAQLAEYFTIPSLMKACEEELSLRVTAINCKQLSEISKDLNLEYLSEQCSLLTLNELTKSELKKKIKLLTEVEEQRLQAKTLRLYKEIQFDLAHQKKQIKYANYSKGNSTLEEKSENKQNYSNNGLPRKTSNHFKK